MLDCWLFGWLVGWWVSWLQRVLRLRLWFLQFPNIPLTSSPARPVSLPQYLISAILLNSIPPFLTETASSVRGRASLIVCVSCLTMLVTFAGRPSERKCRRVAPLKIWVHTYVTCHVSRTAKIELHALRLKEPERSLTQRNRIVN